MTKKQLAQKRNYFKFVLTGLVKPIDVDCLTNTEIELWDSLLTVRQQLLEGFNDNSVEMGLNVPKKCWCGKAATVIVNIAEHPLNGRLTCKKHSINE